MNFFKIAIAFILICQHLNAHASVTQWALPSSGSSASLSCSSLTNAANSCSVDATNAANISTGLLGLARGGNNADLSATGGASQVLKQTSVGGAVSVARLACADLSNAANSCSITSGSTSVNNTILSRDNNGNAALHNLTASSLFDTNSGLTAINLNNHALADTNGATLATFDTFGVLVVQGQLLGIVPETLGTTPTCSASRKGGMAFTSTYVLCVCNGTSFIKVVDGTACTF